MRYVMNDSLGYIPMPMKTKQTVSGSRIVTGIQTNLNTSAIVSAFRLRTFSMPSRPVVPVRPPTPLVLSRPITPVRPPAPLVLSRPMAPLVRPVVRPTLSQPPTTRGGQPIVPAVRVTAETRPPWTRYTRNWSAESTGLTIAPTRPRVGVAPSKDGLRLTDMDAKATVVAGEVVQEAGMPKLAIIALVGVGAFLLFGGKGNALLGASKPRRRRRR